MSRETATTATVVKGAAGLRWLDDDRVCGPLGRG